MAYEPDVQVRSVLVVCRRGGRHPVGIRLSRHGVWEEKYCLSTDFTRAGCFYRIKTMRVRGREGATMVCVVDVRYRECVLVQSCAVKPVCERGEGV